MIAIIVAAIGGSASAATFTFTNNTPFVFGGTTVSSVLAASAVVGNVTDVNVTLTGVRVNTFQEGISEFDVLLVGPQGTKIILMSFVCGATAGPVDFTFDNAAAGGLPDGNSGMTCVSGTYLPSDHHVAAGGYILDAPAPAPPYSVNLPDLNGLDPNGDWTLYAEEFAGNEGGTIDTWTLTIETDAPTCALFGDEFSDGIVDWNVVRPTATETGDNEVLTPAAKKAEIEATNLFAGCSTCTFETSFQTAGGPGNKVWVLAWFVDKGNVVELLFKEEQDKIVLKHRVNGVIVGKTNASFTIDPNTFYKVTMAFDGTTLTVSIDGAPPIISFTPGVAPNGSVALRARKTTATFTNMCVN
jgi:hypothetical protein